jgi:hypothetical protein
MSITKVDQLSNEQTPRDLHVQQQNLKLIRYWHLLTKIIGPSLTVIALLLSIYQLYQANKAEQEIKIIAESISTKYVDVFPKNMPEIIKLIQKTQKSLTVITDVAAYGHFSNPDNSASYTTELEKLSYPNRKIDIKFVCYDSEHTQDSLRKQFGDFDALKAKNEFNAYMLWHPNDVPKDMTDLVSQIDEAGIALQNSLKKHNDIKVNNIIIKVSKEGLPIFMWISDDQEAIFSLHNYGQSPREDSFRTTDPRFIQRLKEIANEALAKSDPYEIKKAQ